MRNLPRCKSTRLRMKMIGKIDFLKEASHVVYSHHEKWNGKGYPQKLEGENIPLSARIFAIADVFDALTMERPIRLLGHGRSKR